MSAPTRAMNGIPGRDQSPPRENLTRAMAGGYQLEEAGSGKTLVGTIATPGEWAEIASVSEGHFMEQNAPGAFTKTFADSGSSMRFLFQHGKDPELGMRPIAVPSQLNPDGSYRAELLDGLPLMIVDGLRKRQYGSSHTFSVIREDWNPRPRASARNPDALPERTIKEAKVREISVVTWPAYAGATAGVRSMTDEFLLDTLTADPARLRELVNYIEPSAPSVDAGAPPHLDPERRETPVAPTPVSKGKPTVEYITREEKASRVTELKQGLARQAIEYPGVLPTDAQTTWDADSAEVDTLERDIRAWDNRQARLADYAQDETKVERTYEPVASFARKSVDDIYDLSTIERAGSEERRGQAYRDNAMRAVDIGSFPHPESKPDVFRSQIANLLDYKDSPNKELARRILMSTSPIYRRAFNKLCTGVPLSPEETRAAALAVVGTTTTGGFMVPAFFDPTVVGIGAFTSINPYRQACRVEQIVGGNKWTAVATGVVTPIRTTEAAVATEAGPTFEQPTLTAHRVTTLVTYSIETEQDRPDIASELAVVINEGKDTEEENEFTLGDGTGIHAFGMFCVHASVNGFFTHLHTVGAALAHDDAALTEATLPIRHRMNGAWFMSRGTVRAFQALEDVHGTLFGGQYYAYGGTPIPNANGNTGLRILGYPVWEVPSAVSTTAVADSIIAVLCDPRRFVIVDRVGMNVEIIPHILNGVVPTGQRGLFAMWRNTAGSFGAPGAPTTGGIRLTVKS